MLKTIFDFLLSLTHIFFRRKKGERQFCQKCGALVRDNCPCRCCHGADGSGPGSSGSDHGGSPSTEDSPQEEPSEVETPYTDDLTSRLIGWALIGVAVWRIVGH